MMTSTQKNNARKEVKKQLDAIISQATEFVRKAKDASPVYHVTERSAPTALVHGIFDCGIQVPMGQSLRMFTAYTRKGVKALLLCNNNGFYGEDPEVKQAVVDFLAARV